MHNLGSDDILQRLASTALISETPEERVSITASALSQVLLP
jgi:hypothetical protein